MALAKTRNSRPHPARQRLKTRKILYKDLEKLASFKHRDLNWNCPDLPQGLAIHFSPSLQPSVPKLLTLCPVVLWLATL